ncbi:unnamed protein product [Sphagnum troendelagicum]|uniref:Uncharacterized protein n=1 Tax=Sphagnum troendelagicum TaxID=128251 RepID=A0ABP0UQL4_9BRYO
MPIRSPAQGKETERPNDTKGPTWKQWKVGPSKGKGDTPKLASPRQGTTQLPFHTPQREAMPGGKRGLMHSEVHPSFFTSLGILAPPNRKPFRTRIWPVLVREKNSQKEMLVHSKNQALPSLPLNIRITGPTEATEEEWSPSSAWADLIQRIELELEEKILRFKFSITKLPQLEWAW